MKSVKPRIAIQMLKDGSENYWVEGNVDVFIVDEQSTDDRVFRLGKCFKVRRGPIDILIGGSPIGYFGDGSVAEKKADVFVKALAKAWRR